MNRASPLRPQPGLFTWQILLLAAGAGLFAPVFPLSALGGLAVLYALARLARPGRIPGAHLFLLCFVLGCARALLALPAPPPEPLPDYVPAREKVRVTGVVDTVDAKPGERTQAVLREVCVTARNGAPRPLAGGLAWTWMYPREPLAPGARVAFVGRVKPQRGFRTPGAWNLALYWRTRGVFWRAFTFADRGRTEITPASGFSPGRARLAALERYKALVPATRGGAMLPAMVFGDRSGLSRETVDLFRRAGLAHSLALSGLHLGMAASLGFCLAWLAGRATPDIYLRLPRPRLAALAALVPVAVYLWLGGAGESLVRAFLMFVSWAGLILVGRRAALVDALLAALAVIFVFSPLWAYSLGLKLSALAVGGIILGLPLVRTATARLRSRLAGDGPASRLAARTASWALGLLLVSASAQTALLPLLLHSFGEISFGLLWNLAWLPLLGFAVLPTALAGLGASLVPGAETLARALTALAAAPADAFTTLLAAADSPLALPTTAGVRPHVAAILGYYVLLFTLVFGRRLRPRRELAALGLAFALLAGPLTPALLQSEEHRLRLTLLDVGQGQCIVIEGPAGRVVVDGGGFASSFDVGRAVVGPFLATNRDLSLAAAVLTHGQNDHAGGLGHLLEHFSVGWFGHSGLERDNEQVRDLIGLARKRNVRERLLAAGETIPLGAGAALTVLHPRPGFSAANPNAASVVLRLTRNGRGLALMPGDLEDAGLAALVDSGADLSAEVLVAPHHGSDHSADPALLRRVFPRLVLASCGHLNRFGFPGERLREQTEALNATLLTTADHGTMEIVWENDGPAKARFLSAPPLSAIVERFDNLREPP